MTEQDLLILQNFASLWARVQNGGSGTVSEPDVREEVLERLYGLCWGYADMARCARGQVRQRLICLEKESRQMARHLQTGLFLETGDAFIPVKCRIFCKFNATHLQKLWRSATELRDLCGEANSGRTGEEASDLAETAAMADRHRQTLRELLEQIL